MLIASALALAGCTHNPMGSQASLQDRECLARAMYFESNRSSEDGMKAVGTVVMNRVQSSRYPKTICGVVGQDRQFADGALTKAVSGKSFSKALQVADAVIAGDRHDAVGAAMFFHTAGYRFPYNNMAYVTAAGGNVFYEKKTPGTFARVSPHVFEAQARRQEADKKVQTASADQDDSSSDRSRRSRSTSTAEAVTERESAKAGAKAGARDRTRVAASDSDRSTDGSRNTRRDQSASTRGETSKGRETDDRPSRSERRLAAVGSEPSRDGGRSTRRKQEQTAEARPQEGTPSRDRRRVASSERDGKGDAKAKPKPKVADLDETASDRPKPRTRRASAAEE